MKLYHNILAAATAAFALSVTSANASIVTFNPQSGDCTQMDLDSFSCSTGIYVHIGTLVGQNFEFSSSWQASFTSGWHYWYTVSFGVDILMPGYGYQVGGMYEEAEYRSMSYTSSLSVDVSYLGYTEFNLPSGVTVFWYVPRTSLSIGVDDYPYGGGTLTYEDSMATGYC